MAARIVQAKDGRLLQTLGTAPASGSLYKEQPTAESLERLSEALTTLCPQTHREWVPCHIALPDPVVSLNVLELETLPATRVEREALARWHLAKLWPEGADLSCATQGLEKQDGKSLLLTTAMERRWQDVVSQACRQAGLVPTSMRAAMTYRFNRHHDLLTTEGSAGAMLAVDAASWSLLLWDREGRPRYFRARWRERNADAADAIATEAERIIRAYVHGGPGRQVKAVYVEGEGQDGEAAASALDARMQIQCVRLSSLAGLSVEEGADPLRPHAASAIAAALGG